MRAIWRHQRRVARQLSSPPSHIIRPCLSSVPAPWKSSSATTRLFSSSTRHWHAVEPVSTVDDIAVDDMAAARAQTSRLPLSCPGCGAPSQTVAAEEAGYYNLTRSGVRTYTREEVQAEDQVMDDVLRNVDKSTLASLGLADGLKATKSQLQRQTPICDRCHNLVHHSGASSTPILHPSIESIQSIIEESPHKHNHIYHIIDAADFPMSLIPNLTSSLLLPRLRTQNRRSKTKFARGRIAEVSFIITRSDLLAPQKEQVDGLMPYLRETLREALGKSGEKVRLGNVRCVSSKRGWWTKQVKEEVWDRGGAGWMVGKVNVGKSGFFEVVFPKGRGGEDKAPDLKSLRQEEERRLALGVVGQEEGLAEKEQEQDEATEIEKQGEDVLVHDSNITDLPGYINVDSDTSPHPNVVRQGAPEATATGGQTIPCFEETAQALSEQDLDEDDAELFDTSLLPPAQKETAYPLMPTVSSLPGTTASPIRIPFGNGKGELIDLPGIERSDLDQYVQPDRQQDLVMRSRVTPEQYTIKPGQSLLLGGGLIRITPSDAEQVVLAYPFVPLAPHVTATAKGEAIQSGERESGIGSIVAENVFGTPGREEDGVAASAGKIKSAGKFKLKWDITKKRAGPLTSASAAKLRPETLAFKVFGGDILIEGVGWVELSVQVRKRRRAAPLIAPSTSASFSSVPASAPAADSPVDAETAPEQREDLAPYKSLASLPIGTTPDDPTTATELPISTNNTSTDASRSPSSAPASGTSSSTSSTYKPLTIMDIPNEAEVPTIEVFTPEGKFVDIRPPMNAWLLGGKKADLAGKGRDSKGRSKARPRLSMKSLKGSREGRRWE